MREPRAPASIRSARVGTQTTGRTKEGCGARQCNDNKAVRGAANAAPTTADSRDSSVMSSTMAERRACRISKSSTAARFYTLCQLRKSSTAARFYSLGQLPERADDVKSVVSQKATRCCKTRSPRSCLLSRISTDPDILSCLHLRTTALGRLPTPEPLSRSIPNSCLHRTIRQSAVSGRASSSFTSVGGNTNPVAFGVGPDSDGPSGGQNACPNKRGPKGCKEDYMKGCVLGGSQIGSRLSSASVAKTAARTTLLY